jgi:hypothetical protein
VALPNKLPPATKKENNSRTPKSPDFGVFVKEFYLAAFIAAFKFSKASTGVGSIPYAIAR